MALRAATWLAIAVGGTGGTMAALFGGGTAPATPVAATASLPLRPVGQIATQMQAAKPAALGASAASAASLAAPSSNPPASASSAPAEAASAGPVASATAAPLPAAELLPLPATKEKLLRAEMHCDQAKAEFCIVAARSYEGSTLVPADPEKAAKYRRIALTAWISQCDHNSAASCATLASMYRAGSGVPQSDRNADALLARARELCRFNDAPACHELPSP
jgi:TPR repeat protein